MIQPLHLLRNRQTLRLVMEICATLYNYNDSYVLRGQLLIGQPALMLRLQLVYFRPLKPTLNMEHVV